MGPAEIGDKMVRRRIAALIVALALALAAGGPAAALNGMGVIPANQNHAHGVAASWTATWGGQPTFDEHFCYGDGSCAAWLLNTNLTSKGFSHAFFPCNGTNFQQTHFVYEDPTGASGIVTSHAFESGGSPC